MSIFPSIDIGIDDTVIQPSQALPSTGKVFLFDFSTKEFVLSDGKLIECSELVAIKQWVTLCLKTYIDRYKVYVDTGFGVNLEDIMSKKLNDFTSMELEREIKESLLKNSSIVGITNMEFIQNKTTLNVSFDMELYNGEIAKMEVDI